MGNELPMKDLSDEKSLFRVLSEQNPPVARALHAYRRQFTPSEPSLRALQRAPVPGKADFNFRVLMRQYPGPRKYKRSAFSWSFLGGLLVVLALALFATTELNSFLDFLKQHFRSFALPLAGFCAGAGIVLLVRNVARQPLRRVAPPRIDTDEPLSELELLATRTTSRLRIAYHLQLITTIAVATLLLGLVVWTVVLVSANRLEYAAAFGTSSVTIFILAKWKWQPFDRLNEARKMADQADVLATGLRLRLATIQNIADPAERSREQGKAVREYMAQI